MKGYKGFQHVLNETREDVGHGFHSSDSPYGAIVGLSDGHYLEDVELYEVEISDHYSSQVLETTRRRLISNGFKSRTVTFLRRIDIVNETLVKLFICLFHKNYYDAVPIELNSYTFEYIKLLEQSARQSDVSYLKGFEAIKYFIEKNPPYANRIFSDANKFSLPSSIVLFSNSAKNWLKFVDSSGVSDTHVKLYLEELPWREEEILKKYEGVLA
jgi:hypothetical protein